LGSFASLSVSIRSARRRGFVERTSAFCYDPLLPVATRPAPVTLPA
jgi:hypothetical protein